MARKAGVDFCAVKNLLFILQLMLEPVEDFWAEERHNDRFWENNFVGGMFLDNDIKEQFYFLDLFFINLFCILYVSRT